MGLPVSVPVDEELPASLGPTLAGTEPAVVAPLPEIVPLAVLVLEAGVVWAKAALPEQMPTARSRMLIFMLESGRRKEKEAFKQRRAAWEVRR